MPPTTLQTIPITCPFAVWGLDMVGPLKGGSHKKKYLLVMVDKFTKWIEAKPIKTAEFGPVIDFISGVIHRYGVPHSIITDNGTNFTADEVKLWCQNMGIKLCWISGSGRPLRFELWGARGDYALYLSVSQRSNY